MSDAGALVTRAASTRARRFRWIAVAIVAALLALAIHGLDLARAWTELAGVHTTWLVAALACYFAILPLWALQWHVLSPPDARRSVARMFSVVAMTSTVLNTTPLLVGEATGVVLLVTRGGLSRTAALSVLAMDQLLVGIAKLVVLSSAALMLTLPRWMSGAVAPLVVGVSLLLVLLILAAWRHADLARWADRVLAPKLGAQLGSLGAALAPLRSPSRGGTALLLALAKKCVEIAAIVCVQRAFGVSLSPTSGILVLACLNLATLLPLVPGNVGVYEAAVVVGYAWLGLAPERALGIAVVQHLCYFVALALPGAWWIARGRMVASASAAPR